MQQSELESLPDSLWIVIASYLGGGDLMKLEIVSKRFLKFLATAPLWEELCHRRWANWPRYRWMNLRKSNPNLMTTTWKQRFLWVEKDYSRKIISHEELETLRWYFNFTPSAGGRGSETLKDCIFQLGFMFVPDFPPLLCRLMYDAQDGKQRLYVANFPPHTIERLPANGEWIIKNNNVTFVSCHETEKLNYSDRGFQG